MQTPRQPKTRSTPSVVDESTEIDCRIEQAEAKFDELLATCTTMFTEIKRLVKSKTSESNKISQILLMMETFPSAENDGNCNETPGAIGITTPALMATECDNSTGQESLVAEHTTSPPAMNSEIDNSQPNVAELHSETVFSDEIKNEPELSIVDVNNDFEGWDRNEIQQVDDRLLKMEFEVGAISVSTSFMPTAEDNKNECHILDDPKLNLEPKVVIGDCMKTKQLAHRAIAGGDKPLPNNNRRYILKNVPGKPSSSTCPRCGKKFERKNERGIAACINPDCEMALRKNRDPDKHNRNRRVVGEPFGCPHFNCGKEFMLRKDLMEHVRIHVEDKPFVCPHLSCRKRFALKDALDRHGLIHTGARSFKCKNCGANFVQASGLVRHTCRSRMYRVELPQPYKCDYPGCDQKFRLRGNFYAHKQYHLGLRGNGKRKADEILSTDADDVLRADISQKIYKQLTSNQAIRH